MGRSIGTAACQSGELNSADQQGSFVMSLVSQYNEWADKVVKKERRMEDNLHRIEVPDPARGSPTTPLSPW